MIIEISFQGRPGDERDEACKEIIAQHGGQVTASGLFLPTSERDVQAEVPGDRSHACIRALRDRGFKVDYEGGHA